MAVDEILGKVAKSIRRVNDAKIARVIDLLVEARNNKRKVFIIGVGRSGLVARSFAMRLAQLSFDVYVVGETITPALEKRDILFAISGSGETKTVLTSAKLARVSGAIIVAVTSFEKSSLTSACDHYVVLQGRRRITGKKHDFSHQILGHVPLTPLGTIFEIGSAVFLDGLIAEIMTRLNKTEPELAKRHATIE